jgi:hypothetical protein
MITTLAGRIEKLNARLKIHETRAEALGEEARLYERETPDPEEGEEEHLDRIIMLGRRARGQYDSLQERMRLLTRAIVAIDESDRLPREERAATLIRRRLAKKG